jgi:hypothetical protein
MEANEAERAALRDDEAPTFLCVLLCTARPFTRWVLNLRLPLYTPFFLVIRGNNISMAALLVPLHTFVPAMIDAPLQPGKTEDDKPSRVLPTEFSIAGSTAPAMTAPAMTAPDKRPADKRPADKRPEGSPINAGKPLFSSETHGPTLTIEERTEQRLATRPKRQCRDKGVRTDARENTPGHCFVVGGLGEDNAMRTTVLAYNPIQNDWTTLTPMSTARSDFALCVLEDALYVFGGWTATGKTAQVEKYVPATNTWHRLKALPLALYGHSACVVGEAIYVLSGNTGSPAHVFKYDTRDDVWHNVTPMPSGRAWASVATLGHRVLVAGGFDRGYENSLLAYDTIEDKWDTLAPMPTSVTSAGVVVWHDQLFLFGGINPKKTQGSVYGYDSDSNTWRSLAPMPIACRHVAVFVDHEAIHILGGMKGKEVLNIHLRYEVRQNEWTRRQALPEALTGARGASLPCS